MKTIRLNDGTDFPMRGLGTWQLPANLCEPVINAIDKAGYLHHVDTAQVYNNEYDIGQTLSKLQTKPYVTTKVWQQNYKTEETVIESIKQSLKRLQMDKVDLILLHWPQEKYNVIAWKALIKAQQMGLTTSIGVANFRLEDLKQIIDATGVVPVMDQIKYSPLHQHRDRIEFCKQHNIQITGYSSLNSFLGDAFKEATDEEMATVQGIADKLGTDIATVITQFCENMNVSQIPRSSKPDRNVSNMQIGCKLSDEDMDTLKGLDRGLQNPGGEDLIATNDPKGWFPAEKINTPLLFDKHF